MDITAYDSLYRDMLSYSVKERPVGADFSVKAAATITNNSTVRADFPKKISGYAEMSVMIRNTSDMAIAFWPFETKNNVWMLPTNHNANPVIKAEEGWIELTYDISDLTVGGWLATYGPWKNGSLEFYMSGIKLSKLHQLDVTSLTGSTYSETADGIKVDFDGTTQWCDINFTKLEADNEVHIFLKNDSDYRRMVLLYWAQASKVLDANGTDVTDAVVVKDGTILPANSGWLEVIYPKGSKMKQLNSISLLGATGGAPTESVGSLYIKGYYTK